MIEPQIIREPKLLIYGNDQAHVLFEPKGCMPLNREGYFVNRKLPSEAKLLSQFWMNKRKLIALLGIVSSGALVSILAQETDILNTIFGTIADFIWAGLGYFWGLIL